MILILSSEDDHHVHYVSHKLDSLGAEYLVFDPANFPAEAEVRVEFDRSGLVRQVLHYRGQESDLASVRAVWHRRPGIPNAVGQIRGEVQRKWVAQESAYFLSGVYENMDCLWVPGKPHDINAAQNKVKTLGEAARLGFRIPRTRITNSPEGFLDFYTECGSRLVTKALWDGLVYRDSERQMAFTHVVRRRDAARYRSMRFAPLILQEYVDKQVELRVTVVGSKVFAAEIKSQASRSTKHDWRHYDNDRATYASHLLPSEIETLCVQLLRTLRLSFGAIDMVLTPTGEYVFLEINPSGQWSWIENLTGLPISNAIVELLVHGAGTLAEGA